MSASDASPEDIERPEDLYGLDLASFTAARNALAKRVRGRGEKAEAATIAKLRRPPITAWALNQVARDEGDVIDALGRAGDALAAAMERALGGDASGVRDAQLQERVAVEAALDAAATHLEAVGHRPTEQARQRMAQTLRACLVDDQARAKLVHGVLDGDVDSVGFGMGDLSGFAAAAPATRPEAQPPVAPAEREPVPPEPPAPAPQEPDPELVRRVAVAREERDERVQAREVARAEVESRRAVVDQRRQEEAEARQRADEAQALLDEAEQAEAEVAASLQRSEQRLGEAERALEQDGRG